MGADPGPVDGYQVDFLVQGYPGQSMHHGGLGWSSITLLRGYGRVCLIDTGSFGVRPELRRQLSARGIAAPDVTDVLLTHAHYDHAVNYVLFPHASIVISAAELAWAAELPPDFDAIPELYVRELAGHPRTRRVEAGEEIMPGIHAVAAPGHTPGSLVYHVHTGEQDIVCTGDAAKNRAELLSRSAGMSLDPVESRSTFDTIWELWRARPGTLLVPGHDVPMTLDDDGHPQASGRRLAGLRAWLGDSLTITSEFDLRHVEGS